MSKTFNWINYYYLKMQLFLYVSTNCNKIYLLIYFFTITNIKFSVKVKHVATIFEHS